MSSPNSATSSSNSTTIVKYVKGDSPLFLRAQKVAELTGVDVQEILEFLQKIGIDDTEQGIQLLDSDVASAETLETEFSVFTKVPTLKRKAAVAILKGSNPFGRAPEDKKVPVVNVDAIADALKAHRNIAQMKDRELIEIYDKDRDFEVEQELNRRAKGQRFVVLNGEKYEPGKEAIDIETSTELLKKIRKGFVVPTVIPGKDNKFFPVYRITELNPEDRIVELCPICGEILYKGYCDKCQVNFSGVGEDERAYVKLIVACEHFNSKSFSDRKAVHASASKGLEDLMITWPSIRPTFEELKLAGNLPKLRMIKNIPTEPVADPFHVSGHRTF
jgi:hypothetical protein